MIHLIKFQFIFKNRIIGKWIIDAAYDSEVGFQF